MTALQRALLRDLLRHVSRSFYLTLAVVPGRIRLQLGLAYLFARAADTIADTDLIDHAQRLRLLKNFKDQFAAETVDLAAVRSIQGAVLPHQAVSAERTLLTRLEDCFHLYGELTPEDRRRIAKLMTTLTCGMELDLTVFPFDSPDRVIALPTLADLDRYTYFVAGCVGEFWTEMACAHLPSLAGWNVREMADVGVRFGKGLQLTNVVKDMARDLQRGRCYLPENLLEAVGLVPADLLKKENLERLKPVLRRLITVALEHLDQGWMYTLAIPRREVRLRLACMWPILFAGRTLQRVAVSPDLLDPRVIVKMRKGEVYRIMALTALTAGCGYVGTAYWGRIRKQVL